MPLFLKICRTLYHLLYLALGIIFIASCNRPGSGGANLSSVTSIEITDTSDVQAVHNGFAAIANTQIRDSLYQNFLGLLFQRGDYDLLEKYLEKYSEAFSDNLKSAVFAKSFLGEVLVEKGYLDRGEAMYIEALVLAKQMGDVYEQGIILNYLGILNAYRSFFNVSNRYFLEALKIFEAQEDTVMLGSIQISVAANYMQIFEIENALFRLEKAEKIFQLIKDSVALADVNAWRSLAYVKLNLTDSAIVNAQKAVSFYKGKNLFAKEADAINQLAKAYLQAKAYGKALTCVQEARRIAEEKALVRELVAIKLTTAICLHELGNQKKAIEILSEILPFYRDRGIRHFEFIALDYWIKSQLAQRQEQELFNEFRRYVSLRDSIAKSENAKSIAEINTLYETEKKDRTLASLKAENQVRQSQNRLFSISLIFAVVVAIVIWLFYKNLRSKDKKIFAIQNALKLKEIAEANLEIARKNDLLRSFADSLVSKNKLIEEISYQLEQNAMLGSEDKSSNSEGEIREESRSINWQQLKILTEEDWLKFKKVFDEVHPGFILQLRERYPLITASEERLLLLTRLNFETKEIADLLGISVESVRKGRYRLKKKLNLDNYTPLDEFIKKL